MPHVNEASSFFAKEVRAYLKLCEAVNTPRAITCFMLASANQWGDLLELENHHDDMNVRTSSDNYLITSCMRKNPRLPLGIDVKQAALNKFLECEATCHETNRRFATSPDSLGGATGVNRQVLRRARSIIRKILGPLSTTDLENVWKGARFGNGSTSCVSGTDVSSSRKYSTLGGTPRLIPMLKTLLPSLWWEGAGTLDIPRIWHSKVSTVPKTAKTERPICIEPHLNIWVQLGIGKLIKSKLRRFGLDLSVQADVNRFLASKAFDWDLATIDLESASDTIASALVYALLPKRWVHLLEIARTDYTELPDGTIIRLEKWSSMGNGYTFELESLIFYSLALACSNEKVTTVAFGDDIILPASASAPLITVLEFCGFKVNRSKTFLAGAFFESCGTDWLRGINIRPFYMKHEVGDREDQIDATFKIANQIRLYSTRFSESRKTPSCDKRYLNAWLTVRSWLPDHWKQCRIPEGSGDDRGLISNFDEASPSFNRKFGEYQFRTRHRPSVSVPDRHLHGRLLNHSLRLQKRKMKFVDIGIHDYIVNEPYLSITTRGKGIRYRRSDVSIDLRGVKKKGQLAVGHCTTWPSLGPWLN